MVSHNKEADQTVKTQHFLAGKTLTGIPSNANIKTSISNKNSGSEQKREDHGCIAYIPILDIVETRDMIQRTTYAMFRGMDMQADLYYNRLLKPVKQFFSCRALYIYIYIYIVYLFISCFI